MLRNALDRCGDISSFAVIALVMILFCRDDLATAVGEYQAQRKSDEIQRWAAASAARLPEQNLAQQRPPRSDYAKR